MRLLLAALLVAGMTASGQTAKKPDVGTGEHRPEVDFFDSTADYFRISSRAVEAIYQKGIKAEEIPAVLMITRKSGWSPNQVIDARKSGKNFEAIAREAGVKGMPAGKDFLTESNVLFLSEYHGQPRADVERMRARGASWIDINQQYRRVGVKARTEQPAGK